MGTSFVVYCLYLLTIWSFSHCAVLDNLEDRIVNGIPTTASEFPFMASLSITVRNKPFPFCGASLLRKEYPAVLLTAAHCLREVRGRKITVDLYRDDVYPEQPGDSGPYLQITSSSSIYHEDFNETTFENDIGLLFLEKNLRTYTHLEEVEIRNTTDCCEDGEECIVLGYGTSQHNGNVTDTLEYTTLQFMDRDQCNMELTRWYIEESNYTGNVPQQFNASNYWIFASDTQICATGNDTDACQGDSGGPLVKKGSNEQIGIISTGFGCNDKIDGNTIPSIYTNVGMYYQWIHEKIDGHTIPIQTTQMYTTGMWETENSKDENEGDGDGDDDGMNVEEMSNTQLAIGCAVAGAVLCLCVIIWQVRSRKKGRGGIYEEFDRDGHGNGRQRQREVQKNTQIEGGVPTKRTDVEMNSTSLIAS